MKFSLNYLYTTLLVFSIVLSACNKDENDSIEDPEETLKEFTTSTEGFTTTDTTITLPETSFGNESGCKKAEDDTFNAEFLRLINEYRKSIGIGTLSQNTIANYLAFKHTKYMICTNDFDHTNFSESNKILKETVQNTGIAENIIAGYNTPQKMLNGWLTSPGHKKNIENPAYTHTGFSTIKDSKKRYWATQIFYK